MSEVTTTARRYVDGKLSEPSAPAPARRQRGPNAVACMGTCGRQVRLTILGDRGLLIEGDVVRRIGADDVAAVLAIVDRSPA
jgi:hypothetical protein